MYSLAIAFASIAFGLLLGARGRIVTWTLGSAMIAALLLVLLWRGNLLDGGIVLGGYLLGLFAGLFRRR